MIKDIIFALLVLTATSYVYAEDNLITLESHYSAKETADRLEDIIKRKGLTLFARIDHQQNASAVNLVLRPTELIIFGNPKAGTPLMQCAQKAAMDLPQKALIYEGSDQKVWLSYNNPDYIKERHHIVGCDAVIDKISTVLKMLGTAATSK